MNLKILWGFKGLCEESSNEQYDTGWKGQKGSMENLGF